jgi:hypothetical protein
MLSLRIETICPAIIGATRTAGAVAYLTALAGPSRRCAKGQQHPHRPPRTLSQPTVFIGGQPALGFFPWAWRLAWSASIKERDRSSGCAWEVEIGLRPVAGSQIHTWFRIDKMRFTQLILMTCLALVPACQPAPAAEFRAAAVKADITPQTSQWLMGYNARKSTGVLDRIYHRVVAMSSGDQQFYLVASDLCLFSPQVYDDVARDLEAAGIQRTSSAVRDPQPCGARSRSAGDVQGCWDAPTTSGIDYGAGQHSPGARGKEARDKPEPAHRLRPGHCDG